MPDEQPKERWSAPKAVLLTIAGFVAAIVGFTEQGQKLLQFALGQMPNDLATNLPFGDVRAESDRVETIFTNRYVTDATLEELCGKPIAERHQDQPAKGRVLTVYKGRVGLFFLDRSASSVESLIFVPSYRIRTLVREMADTGLAQPYSLRSIKKAYPEAAYFLMESDSKRKSVLLVMDVRLYGSDRSGVQFQFDTDLGCTDLNWLGMRGGEAVRDIPCRADDAAGRIISVAMLRPAEGIPAESDGKMRAYSKVFDAAANTSGEFSRQLYGR